MVGVVVWGATVWVGNGDGILVGVDGTPVGVGTGRVGVGEGRTAEPVLSVVVASFTAKAIQLNFTSVTAGSSSRIENPFSFREVTT